VNVTTPAEPPDPTPPFPDSDLGPWAAYTLGFEPLMLREWDWVTTEAAVADPRLENGVPTAAHALRLAAAVVDGLGLVAPEICSRFIATLDRVRTAVATAVAARAADRDHPGAEARTNELENLRGAADAFIPTVLPLGGWYVFGRVTAHHLSASWDPTADEGERSVRWLVNAAARLPADERRRVPAIDELVRLGREVSGDEDALRRAFVVRFGGAGEVPSAVPPAGGIAPAGGAVGQPGWREALKRAVAAQPAADSEEGRIRWRTSPSRWLIEVFHFHSKVSAQAWALIKTPHWNQRELTYMGLLIKKVAKHAHDVRPVLDAFEAAGWPREIGYVFRDQDKKNDTVKSLNNGHQVNRIRFSGAGKLNTVRWEVVG